MGKKQQRRLAGAARQEINRAEAHASGLRAQARDRERREMIKKKAKEREDREAAEKIAAAHKDKTRGEIAKIAAGIAG